MHMNITHSESALNCILDLLVIRLEYETIRVIYITQRWFEPTPILPFLAPPPPPPPPPPPTSLQ